MDERLEEQNAKIESRCRRRHKRGSRHHVTASGFGVID
jgi:hypothetical protein